MTRALQSIFLTGLALLASSPAAVAQFSGAPDAIAYQGFLTDSEGTPLDGPQDITIRLYDDISGDTQLWRRSYTGVPVSNGAFSLELDEGTPDLGAVAFDKPVYLQVEVGGQVLSPRTRLASAPYALGLRNLRIETRPLADGPNMIGGWIGNGVTNALVDGATIGGGGRDLSGGTGTNIVAGGYGTIAGGYGGRAGTGGSVGGGRFNQGSGFFATVAGGAENTASGQYAAIGGGFENVANGNGAVVPGGYGNHATSETAFAAGNRAKAITTGTFVWADATDADFTSTNLNQFLIRAGGGVGIGTTAPTASIHVTANSDPPKPHLILEETESADFARMRLKNTSNADFWGIVGGGTDNGEFNVFHPARTNVLSLRATGDPLMMYNGAKLTAGGAWTNASSVHLKRDFEDVDAQALLDRIGGLSIQQWSYTATPDVRHIGPTAQDFFAAFGLGDTDEGIATVDADGVALAAIQALIEQNRQQEQRIVALERDRTQLLDLLQQLVRSE